MSESNIQITNVDGKLIQTAFDIYTQMLKNTTNLNKDICSICASYFGINSVSVRNHFHGSEFGQCYRKTQLDLFPTKKNNKDEYIRSIFLNDGHLHELSSIDLLSQSYIITHKDEEKIIERRIVIGKNIAVTVKVVLHTDCILEIKDTNKRFIVEFKAVKDWYWKNKLAKQQISLSYYGQCQLYMEAYEIDTALLQFKNRHTSEISPFFVIPKDNDYIRQRFIYLALIKHLIDTGELAPKEYSNKKVDACVFCNHKEICWNK